MIQRNTSKAAENNKQPILEKLTTIFADVNDVLEIGTGNGQHAVHFARAMPHLIWQTSDRSENLADITLRLNDEGVDNALTPFELDVDGVWPQTSYDAIFSANAIHIMGWESVESLFGGIGGILRHGGLLVLYGPFKYGGDFTTESNAQFDLWLKSQNPVSGIRDFEEVDALARAIGLGLIADHPMPSNNQLIVWGS